MYWQGYTCQQIRVIAFSGRLLYRSCFLIYRTCICTCTLVYHVNESVSPAVSPSAYYDSATLVLFPKKLMAAVAPSLARVL